MSIGGKIEVYLEHNSPWSFMAFNWLRRNRAALQEHGVTVDFNPVFLGGLNSITGNKPPWTVPAKAAYGGYDMPRGLRYFDLPPMTSPSFFPIVSVLPARCMLYIKSAYPPGKFEDAFYETWLSLWHKHEDISKPEFMAKCLSKHFSETDVQEILKAATDPKWKKALTDQTTWLAEKGAFGAPWFLVTDREGKEEGFFGSDRFHFIMQYLGVPFSDITIQSPASSAKL